MRKLTSVQDLSFLNRDLSKVILMDTVPAHASKQPENAIILPKWKGDPTDKDLVSYIPFLEFLATYETKDTREMLKGYEGKHIPTEFARRDAILRERALKEQAESGGKRSRRSVGFLGNVLGLKTQGSGIDGTEQSISEAFEEGKTWQDRIRERGQKNYEILDKEIRENGEKWLKDMAEDEKKMNDEAMKGMKASFTSAFPFGLRSSSQSDEKKS